MTIEDFTNLIKDGEDVQFDNNGQAVVYTGIYRWEDGSFHTEPEFPDN